METLIGAAGTSPADLVAQVEQLAAIGVTDVCLASGRGAGRTPTEHLDVLLAGHAALAALAG